MKRQTIVLSLTGATAVSLLALGTAWKSGALHRNPALPVVAVVPVNAGTLQNAVMAEGSIVPVRFVNVSMDPGLVAIALKVYVNIGDHVKKGQLLAEFDPVQQNESYVRAQDKLIQTRDHLEHVLNPYPPQELIAVRHQVEADQASLRSAESNLALVRQGTRPELLQEARLNVEGDRNLLQQEQANNQRLHELLTEELVPRVTAEDSDIKLKNDQVKLETDQAQLTLLLSNPRPEEVAMAQAGVDAVRFNSLRDLAGLRRLQAGSAAPIIEQAVAGVAAQVASVKAQRTILDHRFVRAPIDGIITARNVNAGELVRPQDNRSIVTQPLVENKASLFSIADNEHVEFLANVDQRFYGDLHEGMPVQVGIESLPGRTFHGRLTRKQPQINLTIPKGNSLLDPTTPLTFFAWATVDNTARRLVPGQTGLISVSSPHPGLLVPQSAVTSFTLGDGLVYVEKGGSVHLRHVRYDDSQDGQYRVLSGLRTGEYVVVSSNLALQDGLRVKPVVSQPVADNTLAY